MKSISGVTRVVSDIDATSKFYESLGFRPGNQESDAVTFYLNWFWMKFTLGHVGDPKSDTSVNIKVDGIDEFYKDLIAKGFKTSGEPSKQPNGNWEFELLDPDGYRLVFFTK